MKTNVLFVTCLALIGIVLLTGCVGTTVYEYDKDTGALIRKTETKESILEQVATANKDNTVILFRESIVAGLIVSPFNESSASVLSCDIFYSHKNLGFASIQKDQKNMEHITEFIKALKQTATVSASPSGISSSSGSPSTETAVK